MYRPIKKTPNAWDGYMKPFQITDSVYYVGAYQVCTHLIDTGDGLIIIDAGYSKCLYMVMDSIHRMGFDPFDIKYIITSHYHYDHTEANAALKGLTGAKVVVGEIDAPIVDQYYGGADVRAKDGDTLTLGSKTIHFLHTPGHTSGCISYWFEDTYKGKPVVCGSFGGAGANTLTMKSQAYYVGCTDDYLRSLDRLEKVPVTVFLGNHTWNNDTEGKGIKLLETGVNDFVEAGNGEWMKFLKACRERCLRTIEKDKAEGRTPPAEPQVLLK